MAIGEVIDGVSLALKPAHDVAGDFWVVFDEEDTHGREPFRASTQAYHLEAGSRRRLARGGEDPPRASVDPARGTSAPGPVIPKTPMHGSPTSQRRIHMVLRNRLRLRVAPRRNVAETIRIRKLGGENVSTRA